jgi:hypothetical protein
VTSQIPDPAGGVKLETFIPWTLVKRGVKKQDAQAVRALIKDYVGIDLPIRTVRLYLGRCPCRRFGTARLSQWRR